MSVHASTCASYDFNTLTPVVWKLWHLYDVCFYTLSQKYVISFYSSNESLFYVKLGKNASDTCAMLSEAYGEEAMKKSSVFEWHKWFKEGHENVEDDERSGYPRSHRTNENVEKCRIWCILTHLRIRAMAVQLNLDKETVTCTEKGPNFGPMIGFSTLTMLQLTRYSLSCSF